MYRKPCTSAAPPPAEKASFRRQGKGGKWLVIILGLSVGLVLCILLGPRLETEFALEMPTLPEGDPLELAAWFNARESALDALKPGNAGRVDLFEGAEGQAPLALIYLHGFGASPGETAPLMEELAESMGAHLVVPRLRGHGFVEDRMGREASLQAWMEDTLEALALGHALGERVIVAGYSNGANLALLAQIYGPGTLRADGIILLAPNFLPADPAAGYLAWPWARYWIPRVFGQERIREPLNPKHEQYWSQTYATNALFPMMASVERLRQSSLAVIEVPVLLLYADEDRVVDISVMKERFETLGSPDKELRTITGVTDPQGHLIAGAAVSPETTTQVAEVMRTFILRHFNEND